MPGTYNGYPTTWLESVTGRTQAQRDAAARNIWNASKGGTVRVVGTNGRVYYEPPKRSVGRASASRAGSSSASKAKPKVSGSGTESDWIGVPPGGSVKVTPLPPVVTRGPGAVVAGAAGYVGRGPGAVVNTEWWKFNEPPVWETKTELEVTPIVIGGMKLTPAPGFSDAQDYENRYGELGGSILGVLNIPADLIYSGAGWAASQWAPGSRQTVVRRGPGTGNVGGGW